MVIVMERGASPTQIQELIEYLQSCGYDVQSLTQQGDDSQRTLLNVSGPVKLDALHVLREFAGVAKVVRVAEPFDKASLKFRSQATSVSDEYGTIGGADPWIALEPIGADDESAQERIRQLSAGRPFDAIVTREQRQGESLGALPCLSLHPTPSGSKYPIVFVDRPPSWGADRWIMAAETELRREGVRVVLMESGGEYPSGARTLEIAAIARAKQRTHLPIIVDVPTVAQQARYCLPVAAAAIAAGADGVILRVSLSQTPRRTRLPATLSWEEALEIAEKLRQIRKALRG